MADLSNLSDAELDALDQAADKEAASPAPSAAETNPNNHWWDTAAGVAAVPLGMAAEHPGYALGAAGTAAGLYKANKLANTYMAKSTADIANQKELAALKSKDLANQQELQYAKEANRMKLAELKQAHEMELAKMGIHPGQVPTAGQPITPTRAPMGFVDTNAPTGINALHPAAAPVTQPTMGMAQPAAQMAAPKPPPVGGPAAAEGSNFLENMASKFGALAQKYAPVINNPVTRTVGRLGSVGAQFATYHPELNTGEAEELARRRQVGFQPYSR